MCHHGPPSQMTMALSNLKKLGASGGRRDWGDSIYNIYKADITCYKHMSHNRYFKSQ